MNKILNKSPFDCFTPEFGFPGPPTFPTTQSSQVGAGAKRAVPPQWGH